MAETPKAATTTMEENGSTEKVRRKRSLFQDLPIFKKPGPQITALNLMSLFCGKEALQMSFDEDKAPTSSWPWIAGLYKVAIIAKDKRTIAVRDRSPFCVASIISRRYLITAMHCLMELNSSKPAILPKNTWFRPEAYISNRIFVKLGSHYSGAYPSPFDDEQIVSEAMVFTEGLNYPMRDIALLKLEQSTNFSDGVLPVCIPPENLKLPAGSECFAVGMDKSMDSNSTKKLVEFKMPVRKMEICQQFSNFARNNHHVCAGIEDQIANEIRGGGGLYCKLYPDDSQYYLLGVALPESSWPGPRLFASVSDVTDLIQRSVDA